MKIAYITYEDEGKYTAPVGGDEEGDLLRFLSSKGLSVHKEVWTDPAVRWEAYDLALLKSPWDYFDKIGSFYAWLDTIRAAGVRLLNPVEVVRWNSDKHYLADIAAAGLPVTPTLFLEKDTRPDLTACFDQFGTDRLIVKPCVSGGSKNTFALTREQVAESSPRVEELLKQEAFMAQPFIEEIRTEGEWSLLFFGGQFSHCVLKKAKPGDFRVQHYLGGTIHPQVPAADLLAQASAYVEQFAKGCLYARVDGTLINGRFVLMELELIEPFLFLFTHPESFENYFRALDRMVLSTVPGPVF
ncbi:ATP-grasp domain-containing protein [Tellurirhabdus rosea]|uniref:ATP-grasp domain-containing protein n=1 Tax=Tellurirhabdus rosea TaxID=2674997 RepID=UPI00224D2214|nr:hypothetical protein [Tellurirhabdus rosea]